MMDEHGGNVYRYPHIEADFSASINPLGPPEGVRLALAEAMNLIARYPDPAYTALRASIGRYCSIDPVRIVAGNGATELMFAYFRALRPRQVLIPAPLYSEYARAAALAGAEVSYCLTNADTGFCINADTLIREISRNRPDVLVLCNPNNPTGREIQPEDIAGISEAAGKVGTRILLDETFIEFTDGYPENSLCGMLVHDCQITIIRALTKFYALPGLRIGYALCGDHAVVKALLTCQEPWSVNGLATAAAAAAFADREFFEESRTLIQEQRTLMLDRLSALKRMSAFPAAANFVLCRIDRPDLSAVQLQDLLLEDGLLIRDASNFMGLDDSFFRVAVLRQADNERLLRSLQKIFGGVSA